jgi:hypothetical protein
MVGLGNRCQLLVCNSYKPPEYYWVSTRWRSIGRLHAPIDAHAQKNVPFSSDRGATQHESTTARTSKLGLARRVLYRLHNDGRLRSRESTASAMAFGRRTNVGQLIRCESKQTVAAVWRPTPVTGYCSFTLTRERAGARRLPPSVRGAYRRMTPCERSGLPPKIENPVGNSQSQPGSFVGAEFVRSTRTRCQTQALPGVKPAAPGSAGG